MLPFHLRIYPLGNYILMHNIKKWENSLYTYLIQVMFTLEEMFEVPDVSSIAA
jgi:hypothetical protein